jgi:hypothetical protein
MCDGGIVSDMVEPTVEKNLLNALAISELFEVGTPLILSSLMPDCIGLRLAASLRIFQVFLGSLEKVAKLFS